MWLPTTAASETVHTDMTFGHMQLFGSRPSPTNGTPTAADLDTWKWDYYQLESDVAAKLGFSVGKAEASYRTRTLVAEFARTSTIGSGPRNTRWGVAARLIVNVKGLTADANLTLPFIAADAQFNRLEASASLTVEGYVGNDVGDDFPAFSALNVESYARLMDALNILKGKIGKDPAKIRPKQLWIWVEERERVPAKMSRAVAVTYALTRIGNGIPLEDALANYNDVDDVVARDSIKDTYQDLDLGNNNVPSQDERDSAKQLLDNYELTGPSWWESLGSRS